MNILLGITGSVSAYKCFDLTRELIKSGHQVKIILTHGALEFIRPELFKYLGALEVFGPNDDFCISKLKTNQNVLHIELSKWADKIIVVPASANMISKLSLGMASDLLLSTILASNQKPILVFPAMNTEMWKNPLNQRNISKIKEIKNFHFFSPIEGELVCGDVGQGKLLDIQSIKTLIETFHPFKSSTKKILITAGATAAPLDPVRYMTNPSSGKMGLEISKALLAAGHSVTILAGHNCSSEINELEQHPHCQIYFTPTTESMKNKALELFPSMDLYISTGAIADIEFDVSSEKLKKEKMENSIPFRQAADILKEILTIKKPHQKIISFAAETETQAEVFQEKMNRKPVDLMIGNKVNNGLVHDSRVIGFKKDHGEYFFVTKESIIGPEKLTKKEIGLKIVHWFEELI